MRSKKSREPSSQAACSVLRIETNFQMDYFGPKIIIIIIMISIVELLTIAELPNSSKHFTTIRVR